MSAPGPVRWVWKQHPGLLATSLVIMIAAPYLGSLPVRTIPSVVALAAGRKAPGGELAWFLGDRAGDLGAVLVFLVLAGGLAFALTVASTRVAARLTSHANRDLRLALHQRLLSRPPSFLREPGVGNLLRTALVEQTRVVATYAASTMPAALGVSFAVFIWAETLRSAVGGSGRDATAGLVVAGVVVALLVINLVAVWIAGSKSQAGQRQVMTQQAGYMGLAGESIGALRSLQLEVGQAAQHRRVAEVLDRMSRAEIRVAAWGGLSAAAGSGVVMLGIPLLVLLWKGLGLRGEDLAVMIPALLMLQRSISSVGSLWTARKVSMPAIELVGRMLDPDPSVPAGGAALEEATGSLVFRDVCWNAGGREVLRGVTLEVAPGETVALVGAGGSGKSSLLALALRLETPTSGHVTLDGTDVGTVALDDLRRRVGFLEQQPAFFARTVRENLVVDDRDASDDAIWTAVRAARIDELVERIGLDEPLPDAGRTLSGSEKRRMALARLLLRDPDVIFVDELEAGLPQALAQELLAALREATAGKTCLMVTHRPDLLAADRVALLHEGRILEVGTHDELAARSDDYRSLLAREAEGDSA